MELEENKKSSNPVTQEESKELQSIASGYKSLDKEISKRSVLKENVLRKDSCAYQRGSITALKRIYVDSKDIPSLNPSYTNFEIPYVTKCRIRYTERKKLYENQFRKELKLLETFQSSAYEAARFNRHVCITTLWPPLHNRKEIDNFLRNFFKHPAKQTKRLEFLMTQNQY